MLPTVAGAHGATVAPLFASAGISVRDTAWDDQVVVRAQICALLKNLARRVGVPTIGIDLAAAADPDRLGLPGMAILRGRTLRECLISHARHMPELQSGVHMVLWEQQGRAYWAHRFDSSDPLKARFLNEGIAAFLVSAIRAIIGNSKALIHVALPHRPMAPMWHYEEKMQTAVSFRSGLDIVFSFDSALLDRPNALSPAIAGHFPEPGAADGRRVAEEDAALGDNELLLSLNSIIDVSALSGALSLRDAATTLGLSPRSMQRRLAALDTTFEEILDDWRRSTAVACLSDPALRIATVAGRLGYADPAHFIRAFRRWEGMSPTAYRKNEIAGNAG
jgi:AraC-like DNA-binding protein